MDIVVCIKAVCMNPIKFDMVPAINKIDCGNRSLVINESDEYALEQALVLRNKLGGTITVITAGGLASQDILFVAKAKGADRIIRISTEHVDELVISELLSRVTERLQYDLILTGVESYDEMAGQTGQYVAEKLGLPYLYAATEIVTESNNHLLTVKKEIGGGIYQLMEIQLPALLSVQSGIQPLKYTAPAKIIRARKDLPEVFSEQEIIETDEINAILNSSFKLVNVFKPESGRKTEFLEGTTEEIARKVLDHIICDS